MAALALLGSATFNTTSGTHTVVATPSVGDLILIVTANSGSTTTTAAPTDNNSGGAGAYTLVNTAVKATSADTMQVWVRNALIAAASSTTFQQAPGTTTGGGLVVLRIPNALAAGSSAIIRSAIQSNQAAATAPAPVLGATPSSSNAILTAVFNATSPAGTPVRTGYTSQANVGYSTPTTGLRVATRNSGETSATITWSGTSASAFCSIAVEVSGSTVPNPGVDTITDDYSAAMDAAKWAQNTFNGTVARSGGQLVCSVTGAATDVIAKEQSLASYDITGKRIYVKVAANLPGVTGTTGGPFTGIWLNGTGGSGGNLGIYAVRDGNGDRIRGELAKTDFTTPVVTFVSFTPGMWISMRESAGTVYWDTAPSTASDPPVSGDWTNVTSGLASLADFDVTALQIEIGLRLNPSSTGTATGPSLLDGLNTGTTASSGVTGTVAPASTATTLGTAAGVQTHTGVVATGASATTLGSVVGVQTHTGVVAAESSATALSTAAGLQVHAGAVASASSSVAASAPTATQLHVGVAAGASSDTSASSLAGAQVHQGAVAGASSATALSTPAGAIGTLPAIVAPLSTATTLSTLSGTQIHEGSVAAASSSPVASAVAGVQTHQGAVAGASSAATLSTVVGTQIHQGSVASGSSGTAASAVAGVQTHQGAVASANSATALSAVAGTQVHQGTVAATSSATTVSTVAGVQSQGAVAGASSATALSTPAGTQIHVGVVPAATSATALSAAGVPPATPAGDADQAAGGLHMALRSPRRRVRSRVVNLVLPPLAPPATVDGDEEDALQLLGML